MSQEERRLRPHHIFCIHFQIDFPERGEGFTSKISKIKQFVRDGGEVSFKLSEGPDEVCSVCPAFDGKGCGHSDGDEREVRKWDHILLKTFKLNLGDSLTAREVKEIIFKRYPIELCKRCPLPRKKLCNPYKTGQ
jgi:hypothetical protein